MYRRDDTWARTQGRATPSVDRVPGEPTETGRWNQLSLEGSLRGNRDFTLQQACGEPVRARARAATAQQTTYTQTTLSRGTPYTPPSDLLLVREGLRCTNITQLLISGRVLIFFFSDNSWERHHLRTGCKATSDTCEEH